eukprot:TRINITY_DN9413_c0_g2_i2.p1 TRINITY_DN9413_c0_g2~~TRINITY_DN9413_c0_g2_i2.p1  ORF type:complete len:244 (-),score=27.50 TRINITY_DN9413_c0_g2_i2:886-1545(-)
MEAAAFVAGVTDFVTDTVTVARSAEAAEAVPVQTVWYDDWVEQNVQDMTGKIIVITGANSGTGFWCAAALAGRGAEVILACRSVPKAEAAIAEILAMHPDAKLRAMHLDNMDLDSVRTFAKEFWVRYDKLDILVNNAGIMAQDEHKSKDGHDVQFQTNHLAHFLLTALLWKLLLAATASNPSEPARVVSHSSCAHWAGAIKFDSNRMSLPPSGCWFLPI